MKAVFSEKYQHLQPQIHELIASFDNGGQTVYSGRNEVKTFDLQKCKINIKAFKKPHLINKVAYRYFRSSKARRSFEYAKILLQKGIRTPEPIGYMEEAGKTFGKSYYICKHIDYDYTFRDLISMSDIPKRNDILRQFTEFTYLLHEKGVEFLDHSPGNTLIVNETNHTCAFYLVDLNRMKFHANMSLSARIYNFRRLAHSKEIISEISKTYAGLVGIDFDSVFKLMWKNTDHFFTKFNRKKRIKQKIKGK